jgi:Nucleotidyltransferase domain
MTSNQYLKNILIREAVDNGILSRVRGVIDILKPVIQSWAINNAQCILDINPSGSFAKGTANKSGTDIDIFISLYSNNPYTLDNTYENLFAFLGKNGYQPKRQNVSININKDGYSVDLVPARRQNLQTQDHSIWCRKAKTWTKTNICKHIEYVRRCDRADVTRILKLWRNQKELDFPSFYLELTVIKALIDRSGNLSGEVQSVFHYLYHKFEGATVVDPANANNIISNNLTLLDKGKIKFAAGKALSAKNWNEIVV